MKNHKVTIIAEAGVNHNGSLNQAFDLIRIAAEAGADFVKFQTFKADRIVSKDAKKAEYQGKNVVDVDDSQHQMLKSLELSVEDHHQLIRECKSNGINFLSTAFDIESIDFLDELGIPFFKSPSGEITNYPFLKRLAEKGKPVVLSTGMANMKEIEDALNILLVNGLKKDQITVLHCNTEYPTPMEDVNLKAMNTIGDEFNIQAGYSDHTLGIEVPIAAVARGAKVIEKHFTLDRNLPGPDHSASLEPDELKKMVKAIRNIESTLLGDGKKVPSKSELKNKEVARKSIYLAKDVNKGKMIEEDDLIPLRPGNGISPMEWNNVIGKKLLKTLSKYDQLKWEHIKLNQ